MNPVLQILQLVVSKILQLVVSFFYYIRYVYSRSEGSMKRSADRTRFCLAKASTTVNNKLQLHEMLDINMYEEITIDFYIKSVHGYLNVVIKKDEKSDTKEL